MSLSPSELEEMLWKSAQADAPPKDGAKRLTAALTSQLEALSSNVAPPAPTPSGVPAVAAASPFAAWKLVVSFAALLAPLAAVLLLFQSSAPEASIPPEPIEAPESRASGLAVSTTDAPPTIEGVRAASTTDAPPKVEGVVVASLSVDDLPPARATTPTARRLAPAPPPSAPASSPEASTGSAVTPPARSSDLDAEVAALDEVRELLRTGAPSRATVLLEQYDARFPHGLLRPEAKVLWIEACAASGDKARAHDLAVSFLARHPNDRHAERIRQLEAQLRP